MTTKAEKKGPELLMLPDAILDGVETLANTAKANRDNMSYEFFTIVKNVLSKYPAMAGDMHTCAEYARMLAKKLNIFADLAEQIFPLKTNDLQKMKNS
jgi:hypothetical protein